MNAQTLPSAAPAAAAPAATLPDFAVGQIALLRAVAALGQSDVAALAERTGKTNSVIQRDLRKLVAAGLVSEDTAELTPAGEAEIHRLFQAVPLDLEARPDEAAQANPVRPDALFAALTTLHHDQIHIGDKNPRKAFDPDELEDLAADIAARGLKTNLHARALQGDATTHELIAGERRWRAIGLGIERGQIPADFPIPVLVEDMTDEAHRIAALLENIQRVDLNPLEEAEVYDHLVRVEGRTTAEVAAMANKKNREYVQQRLRLNRLTPAEKDQMRQGQLTFSEARKALANRVEPLDLTPRQKLVLAEVMTADLPRWSYTHISRQIAYSSTAQSDPDLMALMGLNLFKVIYPTPLDDPDQNPNPDFRLQVLDHPAYRAIEATLPGIQRGDERPAALLALRAAALGSDVAEDLDTRAKALADTDENPPSAVAWLNRPFSYTADQQAIADAIAAEEAALEAENAARVKAIQDKRRQEDEAREARALAERQAAEQELADGETLLAAVERFEQNLDLNGNVADVVMALDNALTTHGWTPPFAVAGDPRNFHTLVLVDAKGKTLAGTGPAFLAIRRFQAMALNMALGLPASSGPPLGSDDDADAFDPAEDPEDEDDSGEFEEDDGDEGEDQ